MYIIINSNPEAPAAISRKLHKALGLKRGQKILGAISISRIKGTDKFCIVPRSAQETFQTQCSLVTPHPRHNRRTPSVFTFTVPSLEYIKHVTGMKIMGTKVIGVKPMQLPSGMTIYVMQA